MATEGVYRKVPGSVDTVSSAYDLFAPAPTHGSSLRSRLSEFTPTTSLTGTGPIEIVVPATSQYYLDLARSFFHVKLKVTKADGTGLSANRDNVKVYPSDLFMHATIKSVELRANDSPLEFATSYPYTALFRSLLNSSKEEREDKLKSMEGWYEDEITGEEGTDLDNEAGKTRIDDIKGSKVVDFFGKLHMGFFNQGRLLLPNVKLTIRLNRNDANFALNATNNAPADGAKIHFLKCSFMARYVTANPSIQVAHNEALLEGHRALYPIVRAKTTAYTVSTGVTSDTIKIQDSGQCPEKLFVTLLDQTAFNGAWDKNAFKLDPSNVSRMEVLVDGEPIGQAYEPDFENDIYAREYVQLLSTCNRDARDVTTFAPGDFETHRAIFAFDLTPDGEDAQHLIKTSSITLKLQFGGATNKTLTLLVHTLRNDTIAFDHERNFTHTGDTVV